jgi:hypothetical protein
MTEIFREIANSDSFLHEFHDHGNLDFSMSQVPMTPGLLLYSLGLNPVQLPPRSDDWWDFTASLSES